VQTIATVANEHGVSVGQAVLAWTLQQPGVSHVLAGTRNVEQAKHNAQAGRVVLNQQALDVISDAANAFDGFGA